MSVVKQVAKLQVSAAQQEALDRLEQAEAGLKASAGPDAAHRLAKLEALTDLDRFDAVLRFAEPEKYADEVACYAYALYRTGQLEKLRQIAEQHGESLTALLALSQAEFKAGNLAAARKLLTIASNKIALEDEGDLVVNLSAVDALAGVLPRHASQTFDELFNEACALLTKGQIDDALHVLHEANAVAEEDDDRAATTVQAAYAHQLAGHTAEAVSLLKSVDSASASAAIRIVVANNTVAAELPADAGVEAVHVALKEFDVVNAPAQFLQLNANQRQIVARNRLKLLSRAGISLANRARKHRREFPHDLEPSVLALSQAKSVKQLRKLAHAGDEVARLTLAAKGAEPATLPALVYERERALPSARSARVELRDGDFGQLALAALVAGRDGGAEQAAAYFRSLSDPLLREAGLSVCGQGAGLVNAVDSIDALVEGIDAEQLDAAEAPLTSLGHAKRPAAPAPAKKKRSGKRKLPADFDAQREPNPERWLAKQDRSDYKPKKKKTTQATQGAAVSDTAQQSAKAPAKPQPTAAPASSAAAKAKKKKGKGKGRK